MAARGHINWEKVKDVLVAIDEIDPSFLRNNALIGGSACWFYRNFLSNIGDADYPCPPATKQEEKTWLSKDIDFIGSTLEQMKRDLHVDSEKIIINGCWIDTPGDGLTMIRGETLHKSLKIKSLAIGIEFLIANPIALIREKQELIRRGGTREQDKLHCEVAESAAKLSILKLLETGRPQKVDSDTAFDLIKEAPEKTPDILRDTRFLTRLEDALLNLKPLPNWKKIIHRIEHQILSKPVNETGHCA